MSTNLYSTSTGHVLSNEQWLDLHYAAVRYEYESIIRSLSFQSGWRVLDAGCGSGHFIKPLANLVGVKGHITAIDLAPENIAAVQKRVCDTALSSLVDAHIGNILFLPYADGVFDAVWCSSVTQYLNDEELGVVLREFLRVVRPGGQVVIKDFDSTAFNYGPTDPTLLWRSAEAMDYPTREKYFLRPIQLAHWLKNVGLVGVQQRTILVERRQPLTEEERKYFSEFFQTLDVNWIAIDLLPKNDQILWRSLTMKDSPSYIINHPQFFWREGHIIVGGTVAE